MVRSQGSDRTLPAGPSYLVGRDPECDIVFTDARVSWHHAVLRMEDGRWVLEDSGSTNGTFAGERRVDRIEIDRECLVRLGHPGDGPVLSCAAGEVEAGEPPGSPDSADAGPVDADGGAAAPVQPAAPPGQVPSPEPIPRADEPSAIAPADE